MTTCASRGVNSLGAKVMGWKTYTGAAMVGLPGMLQLFATIMGIAHGEALDMDGLQSGATMLGAAFAIAGIGHKTEKAAGKISTALAQSAVVIAAARQGAQSVPKTAPR